MQIRVYLFSWVHQEMLGLEEVWEERGARFWKENRGWRKPNPKRVCSPLDQSWSRIKRIKHQTQYWWWLKIIGNLFHSHLHSGVWQFLLKLYPPPHRSVRAAGGFAGFCSFIHGFTLGHSLREVLQNPLVHSPGEKSQGMTETVPSSHSAVLAVDFGTFDPEEWALGRKDELHALFLPTTAGSCCSQRPTKSIRKCLLVTQTRAERLKCKLKAQPNSCLRVHPELKYLRDECVIVALKGVDLSPFLLISCSDSLPLTFSSREFLIYLP